jgi:hypothetical protein
VLRYLVPCSLLIALLAFTPVRQSEPNGLPGPAAVKQADRIPPAPTLPTFRIPYRLTDIKHILVRAKINGKGPFNFIVDTGAPAVFVAKEVAAQIGLTAKPDGWATVKRLEIEGGAQVEQIQVRLDDPMQLTGINALGLAGTRIDGIFGYNLLARFRLEIDLTQPKMTWTRVNTPPDTTPVMQPITGGKPYTPPKSMAQMESMAKMATALLGKMKSETELRGFVGIELAAESAPVKTPIIIGRESTEREGAKPPSEPAQNTPDAVNIARVLQGSPAARAGLLAGDVARSAAVGAADLQAVHRIADVMRLARTLAAGDVLHIQVQRGIQTLDFRVRATKGGL